jgi:hypothetical protein
MLTSTWAVTHPWLGYAAGTRLRVGGCSAEKAAIISSRGLAGLLLLTDALRLRDWSRTGNSSQPCT